MLSALVAVDGPLGDAVARSLETASPRWCAERISPADPEPRVRPPVDVVVVDDSLEEGKRTMLARAWSAALLVLGLDVEKPFSVVSLRTKALELKRTPPDDGELVAIDPPLRSALHVIDAAAPRQAPVLITGPTGVGKEHLARRVHMRSGRRGAFVSINCAALAEGLAESTLFGHARGAFTGASAALPGAFVEANTGTLFLDEVGELDLHLQAKLLRVLEDRMVRPLGAVSSRMVDVRIVAATNRLLTDEVSAGGFRADLYFRLATFVVDVPPLRERPGDLDALVNRFAQRFASGSERRVSAEARALLARYAWPGNVRELGNVLERAFSLTHGKDLSRAELLGVAPELALEPAPNATSSLAERETRAIERALLDCTGRRAQAAAELGIHRTTLWRKLKRRSGSARP